MRHRPFRSRCRAWLVLTALALCVGSDASAERVRVALLPVLVHSSESRDTLQNGLADMLVARLGRDPRLAVIEVEEPTAATTAADTARAAGKGAGAAWVVFGSFTSFGGGASLDLQLARVGGEEEPQKVFAQAATMGALIPLLDGVAERITARVLGDGAEPAPGSDAGAAGAGGGGEIAELRRRVEALERAVDQLGAARMPEEPKAAPTVQPPGPRPERE